MDISKFEIIKEKYGHCCSWAIWAPKGEKSKSNMGDLSVLDPTKNINLLKDLKPNIVFVGLNLSKTDELTEPFANFHPKGSSAQDYKTRLALTNTELWGGYMTDIIKDCVELNSKVVEEYLKNNEGVEEKNIEKFREELKDLGTENPTIIAFGNIAHRILKRNLQNEFNIYKITHYSHRINPDKYRQKFEYLINQINSEK